MASKLVQQPQELLLGRQQFGFFNDFFEFVTGDLFTSLAADATATVAVTDAHGGVLAIYTDATNNNEAAVKTTKEVFKIAANRQLVAEARIQYSEANTDDANVMFGFMDAVGANAMVDDGGGPKASYSGAVFYKVDGGTNWNVQAADGATKTSAELTATNSLTKTAQAAGGSSYKTFRIEIYAISSTQVEVSFFIDGVHVYKITTTYANATEMQVFVYAKAGGANAETVNVDYLSAYSIRA